MVIVQEGGDSCKKVRCFLGGWRNSVTGLIYYNACTQTHQQMGDGRSTATAIMQTVKFVDRCTNTNRDSAVQVHYMPDFQDRLLSASRATSSPKTLWDTSVEHHVIRIQRCYRAYRARKLFHDMFGSDNKSKKDGSEVFHLPVRRNEDIMLLNDPEAKSRKDFDLFYNMLNRWQMLELERANHLFFKPSRIAAHSLILSKKVQLLRQVDAMKTVIKARCAERRNRKFLNDSSKPLTWENSRGQLISMDTGRAQRARQHQETYGLLSDEDLPLSDRVQLLGRVRQYAASHSCRHSADLARLIDQELGLLGSEVDRRNLPELRNRVKLSFLRLARNFIAPPPSPVDAPPSARNRAELCRTCGSRELFLR